MTIKVSLKKSPKRSLQLYSRAAPSVGAPSPLSRSKHRENSQREAEKKESDLYESEPMLRSSLFYFSQRLGEG